MAAGGAIWRTPHAGQISAMAWIWLPQEVQNLVGWDDNGDSMCGG